jgi:hypothetical protein
VSEFILGVLMGSAIIGSIVIGVAGLPIHRYGNLFFISSSMALNRILRRHEL